MKDQKSWMNGYLAQGWSAVFGPPWTEEVVSSGQSTLEEIDSLLDVSIPLPKPKNGIDI
jgi:hypothetical protein